MAAPDFIKIQDRNTRDNLDKNNFYPATIKNDNEAVSMRKFCATRMKKISPSN